MTADQHSLLRFGLLACLFCLVSCSGSAESGRSHDEVGSPVSDQQGASDEIVSSDKENPQTNQDVDSERDDLGSPIANFLGYRVPGLGESGVDQAELQMEAEEAIASCMKAEGFNYIPWVEDTAATLVPVDPDIDHESRRFAEKYGFGVSTQFYSQEDVGPDLVGHSGDGSGIAFVENPNDTILASLPEEENFAYQMAYWGADSPIFTGESEDNGRIAGRTIMTGGCLGAGTTVIDGEAGAFIDAFSEQLEQIDLAVTADPRYLAYLDEVSRCMSGEGYRSYRWGPEFIQTLAVFDDQMFEVNVLVGGDPFDELPFEELASLTPAELDALYDVPRDVPDEAKARMADIQALEISVATAMWDCGGNASRDRDIRDRILEDLQTEFLEINAELLDEFQAP